MADDKDSQQSNLPWLALLGLVAAGVTTALYFSPLTSSRPPEPAFHDQRSYGDQTIPARLWQDPFKAVDARVHSPDQVNDGKAHNVQEVTDQIKKYVVDQGHDVLILPVMVPSAPYAELAENRLRVRVAVLEGLARCACCQSMANISATSTVPGNGSRHPRPRPRPSQRTKSKASWRFPTNGARKARSRLRNPPGGKRSSIAYWFSGSAKKRSATSR